jgi:hypothetical protein
MKKPIVRILGVLTALSLMAPSAHALRGRGVPAGTCTSSRARTNGGRSASTGTRGGTSSAAATGTSPRACTGTGTGTAIV